ncbi:MAG: hypothetical protein GC200_04320 [Tepidisphaera sp.]|nr:hypothetical protein [Tepidisphaera sp.]
MWRRIQSDERIAPVEFAMVESLADACVLLREGHTPHSLLVAMDAERAGAADLGRLSAAIVDSGCFWMSAWGPGCSHVDDAVDMELVMREIGGRPLGRLLMTAWHERESFVEATECVMFAAMPSDEWKLESWTRRVLVIGDVIAEGEARRAVEDVVKPGA